MHNNPYWHHHDCPGDGATAQPMQVLFTDAPLPYRPLGHDGAVMGQARHPLIRVYDETPLERIQMRWWLLLLAQTCDCAWEGE